jgi:DNA-3-methyladenine glycosylase II
MTSTGARASAEQRAAADFLSSLDDPLSPWVQATGPVDAYEMHVPVVVEDPLQWLSFAIVSQQISMAAAAAIFGRLMTALGGSFAPERVIAADDATLLGAGLSHAKLRAIRGLAEHIEDGRLELGKFASMPDEDIEAELVAVPGIGPWSAQMFMLRCLQRPDIFPAGDLGIRSALTNLDRLSARITPKAADQRSQVWRPYRSYASVYLWGYLWEMEHPTS